MGLVCGLALIATSASPAAALDPIAAHSMLQLNSPYLFMKAMFSEAAAMHASAIRLDVAPALVFPDEDGPPDFTGLDHVMALAQQYHLRVVADLFTIPAWMADCPAPTTVTARCGTDDLGAYGAMIGQIVRHADPAIRDWEIWNEPDSTQFFNGTPVQYAGMLRAAHEAIKAIDPGANVLLGGVSGTSAVDWLSNVFATRGADAGHAFDIANVHERAPLDSLVRDIVGWRWFFAAHGFTGPLWVTEHGYPSDTSFQYDASFRSGPSSQAAYLSASIPTVVDAGASAVFITERDNLGGPFGSEGVLGGAVSDEQETAPVVVEKPAFAAVSHVAACYMLLGRDCPTSPPAANPGSLVLPAAAPGGTSQATVTVSNPGTAPLQLSPPTLSGASALTVSADHCPVFLEPDQTCTVSVSFSPQAGGSVAGVLRLVSDSGMTTVVLSAVAPSVSSLVSDQLPTPRFKPTGKRNTVRVLQRLSLKLSNALRAPVRIGRASVVGPNEHRFRLPANTCRNVWLRGGHSCRISLTFMPTRAGIARAELRLPGTGLPLLVNLRPAARARPRHRH